MIKNCLYCNKETKNPKFCSQSCSAIHNNKIYPKRRIKIRNCTICGNEFQIARRRTCETCKVAGKMKPSFHLKAKVQYSTDFYKNLTIGDYKNRDSNKNKHPLWAHNNIRNFGRSWNKDLQKSSCKKCGYSLHIELCHIKPLADFSDTATLGEVNHPTNIIPLCCNCHWEFDKKLWDITALNLN